MLKSKIQGYKRKLGRKGITRDYSNVDWSNDKHFNEYCNKGNRAQSPNKKAKCSNTKSMSKSMEYKEVKSKSVKRTKIHADGSKDILEEKYVHTQIQKQVQRLTESRCNWTVNHVTNVNKIKDKIAVLTDEKYNLTTHMQIGVSQYHPEYSLRSKIAYLTGQMNEVRQSLKSNEILCAEKELYIAEIATNPHVPDKNDIPMSYWTSNMWIDTILQNPKEIKYNFNETQNLLSITDESNNKPKLIQLTPGWENDLTDEQYYIIDGGSSGLQPFSFLKENQILNRETKQDLRKMVSQYEEGIEEAKFDLLQVKRDEMRNKTSKSNKLTMMERVNQSKEDFYKLQQMGGLK